MQALLERACAGIDDYLASILAQHGQHVFQRGVWLVLLVIAQVVLEPGLVAQRVDGNADFSREPGQEAFDLGLLLFVHVDHLLGQEGHQVVDHSEPLPSPLPWEEGGGRSEVVVDEVQQQA